MCGEWQEGTATACPALKDQLTGKPPIGGALELHPKAKNNVATVVAGRNEWCDLATEAVKELKV